MSKPKQWKQGRELKHAEHWKSVYDSYPAMGFEAACQLEAMTAYPQEAEPDGRLWVGSGDSQ